MTSLPCSVLPRTLRIVLLALAWLTVPAWALAVAGIWAFDDKGSAFATAGAALCTFALFALFIAGIIDRVVEVARERAEREQMLIIAIDQLSGTVTQPQPALRVVQ